MHSHVVVNHRLLEASRARLPAAGGATLHGRGVFTTLAVYRGRPFLWDEHWARLVNHARRAGVGCPFAEADVAALLAKLIDKNGVERGRARVTLLARGAGGVWRARANAEGADAEGADAESANSEGVSDGGGGRVSVGAGGGKGDAAGGADLLILTGDARHDEGDTPALTVSPFRINTCSPLAGLKTVNYLERVLAWEEARERDFDEAVVLNERGEVASATLSNIFWVRQGAVHTPALATGALAGTTRARVLELAEGMGVPVVEGTYTLHELADAEEIFLTSSGRGVALVTAFDFHRYAVPVGSPALRLREAFRQLTLDAT